VFADGGDPLPASDGLARAHQRAALLEVLEDDVAPTADVEDDRVALALADHADRLISEVVADELQQVRPQVWTQRLAEHTQLGSPPEVLGRPPSDVRLLRVVGGLPWSADWATLRAPSTNDYRRTRIAH
jgi:hypothetical protein